MKNERLGCLTPAGLIGAGLTLIVIVLLILLKGGGIFSPGALNNQPGTRIGGYTSHGEFTGECQLCHAPFWDKAGMDARCESCHTAITSEKTVPTSLHGAITLNDPTISCRNCHPDHQGETAALTNVSNIDFPHDLFGYSLIGHEYTPSGESFTCTDCHGTEYGFFDQTICLTCHEDMDSHFILPHTGAFGADCLACHDGIDTYGNLFDHNIYLFPLIGQHKDVLCYDCHTTAHSIYELQSTPSDCVSCHQVDDIHKASLGVSCEMCHTTFGWIPSIFDHTWTDFQLLGKHALVPCEACHPDLLFSGTHTVCYSCHVMDDIHLGRFGADCSTCHEATGWIPALFDHNLASFNLTGAHLSTPCESCHISRVYQGTPADCYSCHAADDKHAGSYGTSCQSCHTTSGWLPAFFDHNLASFILTGAHISTPCESCHIGNVYQGTPGDCYSCHAADDKHTGGYGTSCQSCHTTSGWLPASFDHNLSSFPLTGAHAGLACNACHASGVFNGLATACTSCHSDPSYHAGLFSGMGCEQCHTTSSWTPASFPLSHPGDCDGSCLSHERATCRDCHPASLGTATCLKCHESNNPDD